MMKFTRSRRNRNRGNQGSSTFAICNRLTRDGASWPICPSVQTLPHQKVYTFDLLAPAVKRYSMSVGVSPIVDQINFQASDIPNISSYTSLFDQYRIVTVSAIFKPRATQLYTGNSSGDVPWITTAIDVNDNSVNLVPADRYQSALSTQMTTAFVRRLVPKTAVPVYNGLTSAYMQGRSGWLDCGYTAVPHYQLVVNIGATSLDNQFVYEVDVLYTLQFKLVK